MTDFDMAVHMEGQVEGQSPMHNAAHIKA